MNDLIERFRVVILFGVGLLVAGSIALFAVRYRPPQPIVIQPPPPTATPGPLNVYVSGAVLSPDVYTLPPGALVQDAITMAGGPAADAALDSINLARTLTEGEQIFVPRQGEAPPPAAEAGSDTGSVPPTGPININIATAAELETLPGIGPALAQRIIDYREANGPFQVVDDIQNVSGIGPSTFSNIVDLITVQ